jgi:hypothetical protein
LPRYERRRIGADEDADAPWHFDMAIALHMR